MMNDLIKETKTIFELPVQNKKCSDFDDDCLCFNKEQAFRCWIGGARYCEPLNEWFILEQSDGYCPLIHQDD